MLTKKRLWRLLAGSISAGSMFSVVGCAAMQLRVETLPCLVPPCPVRWVLELGGLEVLNLLIL